MSIERTIVCEKCRSICSGVTESIVQRCGRATPLTHADRIPGATAVDKAAHRVYLAAAGKEGIRWMPSVVKCKTCGEELDTYYCEERLYMVRCQKCEKVMLVKSRGPGLAAIQFDRISREEATT